MAFVLIVFNYGNWNIRYWSSSSKYTWWNIKKNNLRWSSNLKIEAADSSGTY